MFAENRKWFSMFHVVFSPPRWSPLFVCLCSSQMEIEKLKKAIHLTWAQSAAGSQPVHQSESRSISPSPLQHQLFTKTETPPLLVRFSVCTLEPVELGVLCFQMFNLCQWKDSEALPLETSPALSRFSLSTTDLTEGRGRSFLVACLLFSLCLWCTKNRF